MTPSSESLQKLQVPLAKSLDEMSKQTLDALKLVHSFESKQTRSEHLRRVLDRKALQELHSSPTHSRRPASSPERKPANPFKAQSDEDQHDVKKHCLPNMANSAEKEDRPHIDLVSAASSPNHLRVKQTSFEHDKPALPWVKAASKAPSQLPASRITRTVTKQPGQSNNKAMSALRTKGSSRTGSSNSRLLQPTAASAARVHAKMLPRPASKGVISGFSEHPAQLSHSLRQYAAGSRQLDGSTTQNITTTIGNSLLQPGAGLSSYSKEHNSAKWSESKQLFPSSSSILRAPQLAVFNTPRTKKSPYEDSGCTTNTAGAKHGVVSLESKTDPSKTSTPVRNLIQTSDADASVLQSIDYSNFSNFSYVADWAHTPELAKRALEQQNVDTFRLFGAIPPVDIDAIFGAEIEKQKRKNT